MNYISEMFVKFFGENIWLATVFIAMIPIVELRGAIPFATNTKLWGDLALTNWQAFGFSLIGSSIVVPIVTLIFVPLIKWLKRTRLFGKLAGAVENRVRNKANSLVKDKDASNRFSLSYWKKFFAVLAFVAVPLPLTGVWTGSCVAVFLGLDYWSACGSVLVGNVIAGLIISVILECFPWLNDYLLWIFLAIVVFVLIFELIKHAVSSKKQ